MPKSIVQIPAYAPGVLTPLDISAAIHDADFFKKPKSCADSAPLSSGYRCFAGGTRLGRLLSAVTAATNKADTEAFHASR